MRVRLLDCILKRSCSLDSQREKGNPGRINGLCTKKKVLRKDRKYQ